MWKINFSNWGVLIILCGVIFAVSITQIAAPGERTLSSSVTGPHATNELLIQFKPGIKFQELSLSVSNSTIGYPQLDSLNSIFQLKKILPLFPGTNYISTNSEANQIYLFKFSNDSDSSKLINSYQALNMIDLVEFNYYYFADDFTSTSPIAPDKLKLAAAASFIYPKNPVIIGIIDTGIDWTQEQLLSMIWKNPFEQIDGTDNDGNGFIDDRWGWNFVDPEMVSQFGNPRDTRPVDDCGHGSRLLETINQISNYCLLENILPGATQFMILKAGIRAPDGSIMFNTFSLSQAIFYAANHGAKIINLSGVSEFPSQIMQRVIDYAAQKGCAIIASAGNENSSQPHYPAAFENVLAVTATDSEDKKLEVSNYGQWIDVAAPGSCSESVRFLDSTSVGISGASIAAAYVSGLAGLLLSCENIMNIDSLKQRIIWSSENIYLKNPDYAGQLGAGRINAFRALNSQYQPNIIIQKIAFNQGPKTQSLLSGKIIPITISIKNLSFIAQNLRFRIQTTDPYLHILRSEITLPELGYQAEYTNKRVPFLVMIKNDYPEEYRAKLILNLETANGFSLQKEFALPSQIEPPQNLAIINQNPITLTWALNPKYIGYYIYRKNESQKSFIRINGILVSDSSYVDETSDTDNEYVYYVTGVDSKGCESLPSEYTSITKRTSPGFSFFSAQDTDISLPDSNSISTFKLSINSFSPRSDTTLSPGDSLQFHVSAGNKDNKLYYQWYLNEEIIPQAKAATFILHTDSLSDGSIFVKVVISDQHATLSHTWRVHLSPPLLDLNLFTFSPESDTTIHPGDTVTFKINPALENLAYNWFIDGRIDSLHSGNTYFFVNTIDSSVKKTVSVKIGMGDSAYSHQWTITILKVNRPPKILSCTLLDTQISSHDTLDFSVTAIDLDQDSLYYTWYVNHRPDSSATDTFYIFYQLRKNSNSDTIAVQISDRDTFITHYWIVNYYPPKNQVPEIVSLFPPLDATLLKSDSVQFNIHCTDPDGDSLQFTWCLNNRNDTSAHDSIYVYRNIGPTSTNDTLTVLIADMDTSISLSWILWANRVESHSIRSTKFGWYPEQDSLFASGDSLILGVKNANDSCLFQWTINSRIDSTANDSIFIYQLPHKSGVTDTIQVIVFNNDTMFSHQWYIGYPDLPQRRLPLKLSFKPEKDFITLSDDSLKFSVQCIEGQPSTLHFQWLINEEIDTSAHDTTFYYRTKARATKADTVKLVIIRDDTLLTHRWIVYAPQQKLLPAPRLIFPTKGNQISEEDLLTWENDSSLAYIDSMSSLNYLVQLSLDTTFLELLSSDTCRRSNITLNKLQGFDHLPIGKSIYWGVKIFLNYNLTSEFKKCYTAFFYYPHFVRLEKFLAQINADRSINLLWMTSYEKNNSGFNLYRNESENGTFKKINDLLITGKTSYVFQDLTTEVGKTYYYKLEDVSIKGRKKFHQTISITTPTPQNYLLTQNFPNPFNTLTSFQYEIPRATHVVIAVYNVLGRKVRTLVDEKKEQGVYIVYWDANDDQGTNVVSGVYFYHISTSDFNMTLKMLVVR